MDLKLVGAGLGRTGTASLKAALETLLGAPCYHMMEVFMHPDDAVVWEAAAKGEDVDWAALFKDYAATVDWPGGSMWKEMADAFPDAVILLSTRSSAEAWWKSASDTIFEGIDEMTASQDPNMLKWRAMWDAITEHRFTPDWQERDAAMAAYEAHNASVRATADPARLLEWQPGDGWEPICERLGVPVPDEPFPHHNSTEEFRSRRGQRD